MSNSILEIYAIGDKLPLEVLMDIDKRMVIGEHMAAVSVCKTIYEGVISLGSAAKYEAFRVLFDDVEVKWKWTESELIKFQQMLNLNSLKRYLIWPEKVL